MGTDFSQDRDLIKDGSPGRWRRGSHNDTHLTQANEKIAKSSPCLRTGTPLTRESPSPRTASTSEDGEEGERVSCAESPGASAERKGQ